jgi:hypothetical protein
MHNLFKGKRKLVSIPILLALLIGGSSIAGSTGQQSVVEQEQKKPIEKVETVEKQITPAPTIKLLPTIPPTATPKSTMIPTPTKKPIKVYPTATKAPVKQVQESAPVQQSSGGAACNCSLTCTQMTSCSEAQYQLNTCGCSARDADHDGIACDSAPLHCQN